MNSRRRAASELPASGRVLREKRIDYGVLSLTSRVIADIIAQEHKARRRRRALAK